MNLPSLFRDTYGLNRLQRQIDRMFTDGDWLKQPEWSFQPACEVEERNGNYLLSVDLPGMKKDDIKIELKDGMLTISGERKTEKEEKIKDTFRSERYYGSFSRSFSVPEEIKPEQIATEYKDGVLRIAVPKTATESKAHQIKIA